MDTTKKLDFSTLTQGLYTKQDLETFVRNIDEALSEIFKVKGEADKYLAKIFPYAEKQKMLDFFKDQGLDINDPIKLKKILAKLQEYCSGLGILNLTLAYDPMEQEVKEIARFLESKIGKKLILDIQVDKKVIGGAQVSFKGILKDFTLKNRIETEYQKKNLFSVTDN